MNLRIVPYLVIAACCAGGCTSANVAFRTHANPDVDRTAFSTYQWNPKSEAPATHPALSKEELDRGIRQGVDAELQRLGMQKVQKGADVLVGYSAAVEGKLDVVTINQQYGFGPGMGRLNARPGYRRFNQGWAPPSQSVREFEQGTLVLDIVAASSGDLVWRSAAQAEVHKNLNSEERATRFEDVVRRMLDGFK